MVTVVIHRVAQRGSIEILRLFRCMPLRCDSLQRRCDITEFSLFQLGLPENRVGILRVLLARFHQL